MELSISYDKDSDTLRICTDTYYSGFGALKEIEPGVIVMKALHHGNLETASITLEGYKSRGLNIIDYLHLFEEE